MSISRIYICNIAIMCNSALLTANPLITVAQHKAPVYHVRTKILYTEVEYVHVKKKLLLVFVSDSYFRFVKSNLFALMLVCESHCMTWRLCFSFMNAKMFDIG